MCSGGTFALGRGWSRRRSRGMVLVLGLVLGRWVVVVVLLGVRSGRLLRGAGGGFLLGVLGREVRGLGVEV